MTHRGFLNQLLTKIPSQQPIKVQVGQVICLAQSISFGIERLDNNGITLVYIGTLRKSEKYFEIPEVISVEFNAEGKITIGRAAKTNLI